MKSLIEGVFNSSQGIVNYVAENIRAFGKKCTSDCCIHFFDTVDADAMSDGRWYISQRNYPALRPY